MKFLSGITSDDIVTYQKEFNCGLQQAQKFIQIEAALSAVGYLENLIDKPEPDYKEIVETQKDLILWLITQVKV